MTHLGEYPSFSAEEIAILRGWAAEQHRRFHGLKNQTSDQDERDDISAQMRKVEELSKKLGELL